MAHLFSCGRHGDGKFEPTCEYCLRAKNAYWAAKKPVVKDLPPPDLPISARKTDPIEAHDGVARISQSTSENRALILAISFPPGGLNYRQIAEMADIYPTTCSRVITTMVREGSLVVSHSDGRIQYYLPGETASSSAVGE